jgi:hypothetical protein
MLRNAHAPLAGPWIETRRRINGKQRQDVAFLVALHSNFADQEEPPGGINIQGAVFLFVFPQFCQAYRPKPCRCYRLTV